MFNGKSPSSIIIDKSSMNDHFNHFLYSHVKNNQMVNKKVISDQFPTPFGYDSARGK
jgi:hypothetical protein